MKRKPKASQQKMRLIDAPMYSYWQALFLSFYSSRFYVDVFKRWRGYSLVYLLFVIAIISIPLAGKLMYEFNTIYNEKIILVLNKLPPLQLKEGKVIVDKPMPYVIKNQDHKTIAIVDTTGTINTINKNYPDLFLLITKNKMYFRLNALNEQWFDSRVYMMDIDKYGNETFIAKDWLPKSGVIKLKWIVEVMVYPMVLSVMFGLYLSIILMFAFLGQLMAIIIFKIKFTFKESCRLFLVASTPQAIFLFTSLFLNFTPPNRGLYNITLLAIYYSYAILAVRRESKQMVLR